MNHEELKQDITHRIDRLEDDLRAQLGAIESRLDELVPSVIESSTANSVRIDGMSGQIKLIWTVLFAVVGTVGTYIMNKLGIK